MQYAPGRAGFQEVAARSPSGSLPGGSWFYIGGREIFHRCQSQRRVIHGPQRTRACGYDRSATVNQPAESTLRSLPPSQAHHPDSPLQGGDLTPALDPNDHRRQHMSVTTRRVEYAGSGGPKSERPVLRIKGSNHRLGERSVMSVPFGWSTEANATLPGYVVREQRPSDVRVADGEGGISGTS